ncbi:GNAT family N-acetyltransferase [Paenibacillus sp. Marseille-Q4541]|uniref:GNAT family N-acetyltransferase n=1 Tax=Paenibacillus sp. Marseille-Q4541 TaxID=2831522 RepID=UPI001BA87492|nr:GNAT family N-acetyltransferase [Paenibacillus sp. Marseille-Q4541]
MVDILPGENEYYVDQDGEKAATISFIPRGKDSEGYEIIDVDHTFVSDQLKGNGVGVALVQRVVEHARENNLRIVPSCPFADSTISKHPEFQDVLAKQ